MTCQHRAHIPTGNNVVNSSIEKTWHTARCHQLVAFPCRFTPLGHYLADPLCVWIVAPPQHIFVLIPSTLYTPRPHTNPLYSLPSWVLPSSPRCFSADAGALVTTAITKVWILSALAMTKKSAFSKNNVM